MLIAMHWRVPVNIKVYIPRQIHIIILTMTFSEFRYIVLHIATLKSKPVSTKRYCADGKTLDKIVDEMKKEIEIHAGDI